MKRESIGKFMRTGTIVSMRSWAAALGAMVLLAGCAGGGAGGVSQEAGAASGGPGSTAPSAAVTTFQWSSSAELIAPPADGTPKTYGLKDPSIVQSGGKYHVFMTTASEN